MSSPAPQLAYLGLGNMGRAMATLLVTKGSLAHPLIMWNRTQSRATDLSAAITSISAEHQSVVATSVEEAVSKSDIIFSCMADDKAVHDNFAKIFAIEGGIKGKLFVESSTNMPETQDELAKQLEERGASLVSMPVFGEPTIGYRFDAASGKSPQGSTQPSICFLKVQNKHRDCEVVAAGRMVAVLAGSPSDVAKIEPFVKGVMARETIDLTDVPRSKASLLKEIGNVFIMGMLQTLAEGHVLAEKTGVGSRTLLKYVEAVFPGPFVAYSKRYTSGDYYNREEPLASYKHSVDLMHAVKEEMRPKGYVAGIYGAVRVQSGMKFGNEED